MKEEIDLHIKASAKRLIDTMFDAKIFDQKITRDDMLGFEELIAYHMQCNADSSRKCAEFTVKWNIKKSSPT